MTDIVIQDKCCPICQNKIDQVRLNNYNTTLNCKGDFINGSCYNPTTKDPLHYYTNIVVPQQQDVILYESFSLNIGSRSVMVGVNYHKSTTLVWSRHGGEPLELPFLIVPDYPNLTNMKSKIKLVRVFV